MELRWTEEAAVNLEDITNYPFEKTADRAAGQVRGIYNAALLTFHYRGRPGRKPGRRELLLSSLPYIVVYPITGDIIHIARILHGAQK